MRAARWRAGVALVAYLAMVLVCPELHRRQHERYGADHAHSALGARGLGHRGASAVSSSPQARAHDAFDDDLAALGLADVAQAGTLSVDCSAADYTLAACEPSRANHPANFGDELLARTAPPTPPTPWNDLDPEHGAGSPEHLSLSVLAGRIVLFSPPVRDASRAEIPALLDLASTPLDRTHAARGPPPRA